MTNNLTLNVVSGKFRGAKLKSPASNLTHPMGAREKNALFNRLGEKVKNAKVLDAYAGSGALAIEALSRGAYQAILVEENPKIAQIAAKNLNRFDTELDSNLNRVYIMTVDDFVNKNFDQRFDIIIADPPYSKINYEEIRHLAELLFEGGTLVLSHPVNEKVEGLSAKNGVKGSKTKDLNEEAPEIPGLKHVSSKTYAGAEISFYEK